MMRLVELLVRRGVLPRPHRERLAQILAEPLRCLLEDNERIIALSEAVEEPAELVLSTFGATAALRSRVALILTDRRLLEIALSPLGRRPLGRVRSFPWELVADLNVDNAWTTLVHGGIRTRWYVRDPFSTGTVHKVLTEGHVGSDQPRPTEQAALPQLVCVACGYVLEGDQLQCVQCKAIYRSPILASRLSLAFPALGLFYSGAPVLGAVQLLIETLLLLIMSYYAAVFESWDGTAVWVSVLGVALFVFRSETMRMSRLLAERALPTHEHADGRWRQLVLPLAAFNIAVAVVLWQLSGSAGKEVSWDLDFEVSSAEWTSSRVRAEWSEEQDDPRMRSEWRNRDGRVVQVKAWPLPAFEDVDEHIARVTADREAGRGEYRRVGRHDTLRRVESGSDGTGNKTQRLEYAVLDREGRDVHAVSTELGPDDHAATEQMLEKLIQCAYYIHPERPRDSAKSDQTKGTSDD